MKVFESNRKWVEAAEKMSEASVAGERGCLCWGEGLTLEDVRKNWVIEKASAGVSERLEQREFIR